jgi:hypothetical protein
MGRALAAGYNHDLRYRNRVFHVQTEESGTPPLITTDVFCEGSVLQHVVTDCVEAGCADGDAGEGARQDLAQEQHKAQMRRLLRGQLDERIVAALGVLEPDVPQLKRYMHYLEHHGRTFSVETRFLKSATSDVYCDAVLIFTETVSAGPAAAESVLRHWAQDLHKRLLRSLYEGQLDGQIVELLGSLSPPPVPRRRPGTGQLRALEAIAAEAPEPEETITLEHYHHAMKYQGKSFEAETEQFGGDHPHVVGELRLGDEVITRKLRELPPGTAPEQTQQMARELHKQLLVELKAGELDDVIELLDEL